MCSGCGAFWDAGHVTVALLLKGDVVKQAMHFHPTEISSNLISQCFASYLRVPNVNNQYDTQTLAVVSDLVLKRVVKHNTFRPPANLTNSCRFARPQPVHPHEFWLRLALANRGATAICDW